MRFVALLAALVFAAPATADPIWGPWTPPPAQYSATVTVKNVPITMSDGVTLYANVLYPAGSDGQPAPGRFPVILTMTPYNKTVGKPASEYLVMHGYVQVVVDVRGTGSSGGSWDALGTREQRDGYELVRWAATQPFSNGSVGFHGVSYMAINSLMTAAQKPPGLKALFPVVPMADAYRDTFLNGGQMNTDFVSLWFALVTSTSLVPATYATDNPGEAARTLAAHAGGAASYQGAQLISGSTGGSVAYDGPAYRSRSPIEMIGDVDVPTFFVGGSFDLFQRGTPMLFDALQRRGVPTHLLEGPWYHNTPGEGLPAEGTGIPSLDEIELRWDEHYVKGLPDKGLDHDKDIPPVTEYENGSGVWRAADGWPASDVRPQALHLGGPASIGTPGTLGPAKPAPAAADPLPYNPATGACTRSSGQWTAGEAVGTPCDEDNTANDAPSLSYDLPVAQDLHLNGTINAHLEVSSLQGRDGMITARLEDVTPGGKVTQISAGWQVLSFRALDAAKTITTDGLVWKPYHPFTQESVTPMPSDDSPAAVDVEIFPTTWMVAAGHTLRLTLQTSDSPHLTAPAPQASGSGGVLSIHHDAASDSYVTIPVRG